MKFRLLVLSLVLSLLLGCQATSPSNQPVIVTSISIYQDLIQSIVGSTCEVRTLVSGMENPHTLDLSGSKARLIQDADLIIFNGMGLEAWADQVKSGLKSKSTPLLSVADSLTHHPLVQHGDNPHLWMDPRITQEMVQLMLPALQKTIPDSAERFRQRADKLTAALDTLYRDVGYKLAPFSGKRVVAQTPGLDYFFSGFGIDRVATIVDHPGTEPSAQTMTKLTDILQNENVIAIVRLPQFSEKLPHTLSEESGVPVISMSPLINGTEYVRTYADLIWYNADQLYRVISEE